VFETKNNFEIKITKYVPALNGVISVILTLGFTCFLLIGGIKKSHPSSMKILACAFLVLLCNAGFSILAAPVVLRYQVFPFILTSVFGVLLIEYIVRIYQLLQKQENDIVKKEAELTESGLTH
jgi:predicted ABC-type sugar transport system permease subunit